MALNFFQRHGKTGFYQVWLILCPTLSFFVSTEYFILGLQYFLRTEKLALGEVFFVFIHAAIVLGSPYTKIRIFLPMHYLISKNSFKLNMHTLEKLGLSHKGKRKLFQYFAPKAKEKIQLFSSDHLLWFSSLNINFLYLKNGQSARFFSCLLINNLDCIKQEINKRTFFITLVSTLSMVLVRCHWSQWTVPPGFDLGNSHPWTQLHVTTDVLLIQYVKQYSGALLLLLFFWYMLLLLAYTITEKTKLLV